MKLWKTILRWLLVIACLAYLVKFFYDSRADIRIAFSLNGWLLAGILALQLLYYYIQGVRFQMVMEKCSGRKLPAWPWMKLFIIGRFLNTIFAQAGNVSRGVILKRDYGVSYTRYIAANTSMAWMDTGMNLILATGIVLLFSRDFRIGPFLAWKVLGIATVAAIAGPIAFEAAFRRLRFASGPLLWLHNKTAEVLRVSVENLTDGRYLAKLFALGLVIFARTVLMFHLYFLTIGARVDLAALAVFYALFKLSFYINLTPGNLGVQEIVWGKLSELMGIGMAQGVLVSAFVRVVSTGVILVLGIALGGWDMLRKRGQLPATSGDTPTPGEE
jgi:hypothetical protein